MNADQLFEHHFTEIDAVICDGAKEAAQYLLDAGAAFDDLPRLLEPFVQRLAEMRARAVARLQANTARLRVVEARLQAIEAQMERLENGAAVH